MDKEKTHDFHELFEMLSTKRDPSSAEEAKMIDNFIVKYKNVSLPLGEAKKMIELLQKICI